MMRVGVYRPVHVKTLCSQKLRMLLTHRKLLQSKAIAIENDLRGTLRNFGLKVGMVGTVRFEATLRPAGSLSRPTATFVTRLQPSRLPAKLLASFRGNRQLSG
jgi:transposase